MQAAPPVAVRCTAARSWRGLQSVLPALAAGVFTFWSLLLVDEDLPALPLSGAPLAAALAAGALAWRRSAAPARLLAWDGQRWTLDGRAGELQVMIALGSMLLLRHAGRDWLVTGRDDAGAAWHGLCVAVFARSAAAAVDDGLRDA